MIADHSPASDTEPKRMSAMDKLDLLNVQHSLKLPESIKNSHIYVVDAS